MTALLGGEQPLPTGQRQASGHMDTIISLQANFIENCSVLPL